MKYKGLTLDDFQVESINSINKHHSIVVSAPTGSGKTLVADYVIDKAIKEGKRVVYTAPIKALSNQKYKDFCNDYGKEKIGLLTGDEVINSDADVLIMTTEIYRNWAITNSVKNLYYVIFDEIHYINDIERGSVWEESIIFSPKSVRYVCLSATIPNVEEFASWIEDIKEHKVNTVKHDKRIVPLDIKYYDEELGITTLEKIKEHKEIPSYYKVNRLRRRENIKFPNHLHLIEIVKTPCLFFCFSRKVCERNALELSKKIKQSDHTIERFVAKKLKENYDLNKFKSAKLLRQILPKGIAFHHAGLLPKLKEIIEELFAQGKIKYLYDTETFAVGINMPAKTVCFEGLKKFNGVNFSLITSKEFFQMAGRAGRRGIDEEGFVIPMINRKEFSYTSVKRITQKDTEPLKSKFKLSISAVLNLVNQHSQKEIDIILENSFYTFQKQTHYEVIKRRFSNLVKKLTNIGYIDNGKLTEEGKFASRLFVDEIELTEIFCSDLWKSMDQYQIILTIASLIYEARRGHKIFGRRFTHVEKNLTTKLKHILHKKVSNIEDLAPLVFTMFEKQDFFEVCKASNIDEGDLVRIINQIMDRINQLFNSVTDLDLKDRLESSHDMMRMLIEEVS
ncbi:DEAD/DEAH box helicase [Candidatus Woesearchaeota archaeon]|nr:DEAD/DEAH box helicase [Candidatus Woesearchaeota archaeon]